MSESNINEKVICKWSEVGESGCNIERLTLLCKIFVEDGRFVFEIEMYIPSSYMGGILVFFFLLERRL